MRVNFQCIELTIQDEELGCTVTFSDSRAADDQFKTVEELMNSDGKYLLIQRVYPEDDYDEDYYYIESSESDTIFDSDGKIIVRLNQKIFEVNSSGEQLRIGLDLESQEIDNLIRTLETKFNERISLRKQ